MASLNAVPCWICNNDLPLTECKFDEYGKPVHEECSVARIALRNEPRQQGSRPSALHLPESKKVRGLSGTGQTSTSSTE